MSRGAVRFKVRLTGLWRRARVSIGRRVVRVLDVFPADVGRVRTYDCRGVTIRADLSNAYEHVRWDAMARGIKEPETLEWIDREFRTGDVFVDIGACIGNYTIFAARRHPGLKVYAFEPEPNSLIQLVKNCRLNRVDATCLLMAVNDRGSVDFLNTNHPFIAGRSNHQFGRLVNSRGQDFVPAAHIGMSSTSLDALVESGILPLPTHIKIDVDGIEASVIAGLANCLRTPGLRSMLCEISGDEEKARSLSGLIEACGLRCARRPPRLPGNFIFVRAAGR